MRERIIGFIKILQKNITKIYLINYAKDDIIIDA